jgi:hypothetical protein
MSPLKRRYPRARILKWVAVTFFGLALGLTAYLVFFPKNAEFVLEAQTDRVQFEVKRNGPKFAWENLEMASTDDSAATCLVRSLQFGFEDRQVILTLGDPAPHDARKPGSSTAEEVVDLYIDIKRTDLAPAPMKLKCSGRQDVEVRSSMQFVVRGQNLKKRHLPLYGSLVVGGLVDVNGGEVKLLKRGSIKASARLEGSAYVPVYNQFELRPGDEVEMAPDGRYGESLAIGLVTFDGKEISVIAHANGSSVLLRRPGLQRAQTIELKPSAAAVLQGNPSWSLLSLVFTVISGLAAFFSQKKTAVD